MANLKNLFRQGGRGSGNFDHKGRPGQVGGSAPGSGSSGYERPVRYGKKHTVDQPGPRNEKPVSLFRKRFRTKKDTNPSGTFGSDPSEVAQDELKQVPEGYYKFNKETQLFVKTGSEPTNSYYGTSRYHRNTYIQMVARPGDELHMIPGGMFFREKGSNKAEYATFVSPDPASTPFDKSYGPFMGNRAPLGRLDKFAEVREHPERDKFEYDTRL